MYLFTTIIYYFILSFAIIFSAIYMWHKLLNKRINFKDKKLYFSLFGLMGIALLNYFNVSAYLRISGITIILIFFFIFMFREEFTISIVTPIFCQLIIMLSEMIFAIIISLICDVENIDIVNSYFGSLLSNISIAVISVIIIHIPLFKKIYHLILTMINKIRKTQLIFISFLFIIIANILTMLLYYELDFMYLLIFNTFLTLFCFSIVIYTLKTKNNYIKINEKFNTTLNSLKEYEDILDRYRISTHENKNELITIRNLIPKSHKKIIAYIDTIIENKIKDNDKVMIESAKIPNGGIRGLIYSKLLLMKELKIQYSLRISNNIKTVDLINKIDDTTMLDICKVIGVYIDNAIQEVKVLREKNILLEMYIENDKLIISVSNNYINKIDLNRLDDIGYTTKGNNRGYGLSLVKQIINKNEKLYNERKITKKLFTQILKIKM